MCPWIYCRVKIPLNVSFFFLWHTLPFIQFIQSRRVFSKIAPQNTSSDRWSPKSRILTATSFGNNAKCIEFDKSSLYVSICVCVCVCVRVKLTQWNKHSINPILKYKNLKRVKLWPKQQWVCQIPTDFLHQGFVRRLSVSCIEVFTTVPSAQTVCVTCRLNVTNSPCIIFFAWKPCIEIARWLEPGSMTTSLEQASPPTPTCKGECSVLDK